MARRRAAAAGHRGRCAGRVACRRRRPSSPPAPGCASGPAEPAEPLARLLDRAIVQAENVGLDPQLLVVAGGSAQAAEDIVRVRRIFDFLTFFLLLVAFRVAVPTFQAAWFVESLATQALVVFVLRTRKTPFYKSKPGRYLLITTLSECRGGCLRIALTLHSVAIFGFTPPPATFYVALVGLIAGYLLLVEGVRMAPSGTLTSWNRATWRKKRTRESNNQIECIIQTLKTG